MRTLIDELTVPPVVVRDGVATEVEPMTSGGRIPFPDPVGERDTLYTLHSEVRTLPESLGASECDFRLSLTPQVLEALAELRGRPAEEIAALRPAPPSPRTYSAQHVEVRGERDGAPAVVAVTALTVPTRGVGPGRRDRLHGGRGGGRRPSLRARAHSPDGGVSPRALPGLRRPGRGARAAGLHLRDHDHGKRGCRMKVGVPTEIKADEYRVALTPTGVRELVDFGHEVVVQHGAGEGSAIEDSRYVEQGATIVPDAEAVFDEAQLIVKVKEPQAEEVERLRPHHTLFTYLHLAPDPELTKGLVASGATCIAYETVEDSHGRLPLLAPMSEVAGKIATQAGAFMLEKPLGGRGVLLGGVPGVAAANVLVIGGGVVGMNAAFIAIGMEADVFVFDRSVDRLRELDVIFAGRCSTVFSSTLEIEERLPTADLVIGAVLIHGAKAPHVVTREQLKLMKPGAVLVDVSIDQGGCFETSRPTTHSEPTYEVEGVIHYCVTNMPGAVPITSTYALTNATLPYINALARDGVHGAVEALPGLKRGVNVAAGAVTYPAGGRSHGS